MEYLLNSQSTPFLFAVLDCIIPLFRNPKFEASILIASEIVQLNGLCLTGLNHAKIKGCSSYGMNDNALILEVYRPDIVYMCSCIDLT